MGYRDIDPGFGGGGGGDDDDDVELDAPDTGGFVDGTSVDFGGIASFFVAGLILIFAQFWASIVALWYQILAVPIEWGGSTLAAIASFPFEAGESMVADSWETAASSLDEFGLAAWIVAVITVWVWLILLQRFMQEVI